MTTGVLPGLEEESASVIQDIWDQTAKGAVDFVVIITLEMAMVLNIRPIGLQQ